MGRRETLDAPGAPRGLTHRRPIGARHTRTGDGGGARDKGEGGVTFQSGAGEETSHGLREGEGEGGMKGKERRKAVGGEALQRKEAFCGTFLQLKNS